MDPCTPTKITSYSLLDEMLATPTESIAPRFAFNLMVSLTDEEDRVVRLVDISDTAADKAVHDIVVKAKPSETRFRRYKLGHTRASFVNSRTHEDVSSTSHTAFMTAVSIVLTISQTDYVVYR